jgi:hypothetical protein
VDADTCDELWFQLAKSNRSLTAINDPHLLPDLETKMALSESAR